jgi:biotin operon repressor
MTENTELVDIFKALAEANRLKIIGLLARQPYSVEELAALLDLKPPTVSHHLARLAEVGLVAVRAESYYSVYSLNKKALEATSRRLFSGEQMAAVVEGMDLDAYDRKVVADYSRADGGLKTIPAQRKKLDAVLRHIVRAFEPGQRYSEKEVNQVLSKYHKDTASLRRELVGARLLQRESDGSQYWRNI